MHDIANQIVLPVVVILTLCMLALNVIAFHRIGLISRDLRWMRVKLLDLERLVTKDPPLTLPAASAAPPEVIVVDEHAAKALDAATKPASDGSVIYLATHPGKRRPS